MTRAVLFSLCFTVPASAQVIRVRTVEVETGRAVAGAIVVLLDSADRRVVQGLTDDLGRISLNAPVPWRPAQRWSSKCKSVSGLRLL